MDNMMYHNCNQVPENVHIHIIQLFAYSFLGLGLGLGLQVLYSVTSCTGNILGPFTNITSNRTKLQCSRYKYYIFKYNR